MKIVFGILVVLAFLAQAAETQPPALAFSPQETAYIEAHKAGHLVINMCVDPDWVPFERINPQGQHEGIAADLVQLVAKRTGLSIKLYPVKNWDESLAASKAGKCQIMSFLNQTPAREAWLSFTDPIFFDPNIIVTREEHPFVSDLKALDQERVALPRGTMIEERIRRDYPNLDVVTTESEGEAVDMVSTRKADLTVRSLIVAAYAIKKEGLFNLKIAGQIPEYGNQLRIGVLKDQPILRDILNKGVQTLTPQEREAISNKHVSVVVEKGVDTRLIAAIVGVGGLIWLITFLWNRKLRALNLELERLSVTDKLTGLFNRIRLDAQFEVEIQRSARSEKPFGIILVDVDFFKAVNDTHGHQVGDLVLIEMARLLRENTRTIDVVGRWGGEEFLIICPQTDLEGVRTLAEHLRGILAQHTFPVVEHKTASFGVTAWVKGDAINVMMTRVDAALYAAKDQGRNCVVTG